LIGYFIVRKYKFVCMLLCKGINNGAPLKLRSYYDDNLLDIGMELETGGGGGGFATYI
jgi:hypothetical protein